ncbi:MAG: hypothetical protein Q8P30_04095 [Candidatus Uhrbacteria bacterium]|nr:hypothetical protein [Candidatus Uhrbacteria bacterium]
MSKFEGSRAMAHLLDQLGDERFAALIDSANTGKVKELCDALVRNTPSLPTEMTINGRTYDILGFLREDETSVLNHEMITRAKNMNAHLGEDDCEYLLDNQQDIPVSLRRKVVFVFTYWRGSGDSEDVCYVFWDHVVWFRSWDRGFSIWSGDYRVLRRK